MKHHFRWTCPYCGHIGQAAHHHDAHGSYDVQIVICDNEESDGCGAEVVLRSHVEIVWETYKFEAGPAITGQMRGWAS